MGGDGDAWASRPRCRLPRVTETSWYRDTGCEGVGEGVANKLSVHSVALGLRFRGRSKCHVAGISLPRKRAGGRRRVDEDLASLEVLIANHFKYPSSNTSSNGSM